MKEKFLQYLKEVALGDITKTDLDDEVDPKSDNKEATTKGKSKDGKLVKSTEIMTKLSKISDDYQNSEYESEKDMLDDVHKKTGLAFNSYQDLKKYIFKNSEKENISAMDSERVNIF